MAAIKKLAALILCAAFYLGSTTYYVRPGGNDTRDGFTDATAWASVAKVKEFAGNGIATGRDDKGGHVDKAVLY